MSKALTHLWAAALIIAGFSLLSCGGGGDSAPSFPGRTIGGAGNDHGRALAPSPDGGFIIAGSTTSLGAGGSDVYLVKTDAAGSLQWTRTFGGAQDDYGFAVALTADHGFIIAGSTGSRGAGGSDVYLIKTDSLGQPVWEKALGGPGDEYGYAVLATDTGYMVVGTALDPDEASSLLLIATDLSGNALWQKNFGGHLPAFGWSSKWLVEGYAIQPTVDGGYILAGRAESFSFLGGQPFVGLFGLDVYLVKTDAAGNMLWETTLGGAGNQGGGSVLETADGGYLVAGYDELGGTVIDVYLVRTDALGNRLWDKTFGGFGLDAGHCLRPTLDHGYILAGVNSANNGDLFLIKTDSHGNSLWERRFGGAGGDVGQAVKQTADGGYVVIGTTASAGAGQSDIWFLKTDSAGHPLADPVPPPEEPSAPSLAAVAGRLRLSTR